MASWCLETEREGSEIGLAERLHSECDDPESLTTAKPNTWLTDPFGEPSNLHGTPRCTTKMFLLS